MEIFLPKKIGRFLLLFFISVQSCFAQNFAWMKGGNTAGQSGAYGAPAVASLTNNPGAREVATRWTDASGNFWLFGGYGFDGFGNQFLLSDLWKYSPVTNTWYWVQGDVMANSPGVYGTLGVSGPGNKPGAREGAVSWTDISGNLWLFGGISPFGELNDLWKYNIANNEWTWMNGSNNALSQASYGTQGLPAASNVPGSRAFSTSFTDAAGDLWLFGGSGNDAGFVFGSLNDVWKYNIATNQWVWIRGSNTCNQNGIYGNQGISSATNEPGTRYISSSWQDANGNLWLLGGTGMDGSSNTEDVLNDLWKYNLSTNEWTWMGGAVINDQPGNYGTLGLATALNMPGARLGGSAWSDATGDGYLFGGFGYDATGLNGNMNDLWKYSITTNQWTWIKGSNTISGNGVYGAQGQASALTIPGARSTSASWTDASGSFWLFGGVGADITGQIDDMNDLWKYTTCTMGPTLNVVSSATALCAGTSASLTASGAATYSWLTSQTGSVIAIAPGATTSYTVIGTDADGCCDTTAFTQLVNVCTGIEEEIDNGMQLTVYPNPNNGTFTMKGLPVKAPVMLFIYNTLGQQVMQQQLTTSETSVRVSLSPGIYHYTFLQENKKTGAGKLMIE